MRAVERLNSRVRLVRVWINIGMETFRELPVGVADLSGATISVEAERGVVIRFRSARHDGKILSAADRAGKE